MSLLDAVILSASFGLLAAIIRFAVSVWIPDTLIGRLFRMTES